MQRIAFDTDKHATATTKYFTGYQSRHSSKKTTNTSYLRLGHSQLLRNAHRKYISLSMKNERQINLFPLFRVKPKRRSHIRIIITPYLKTVNETRFFSSNVRVEEALEYYQLVLNMHDLICEVINYLLQPSILVNFCVPV